MNFYSFIKKFKFCHNSYSSLVTNLYAIIVIRRLCYVKPGVHLSKIGHRDIIIAK